MDDLPINNNREAYEKPLSLWRLVEELVAPGERPDIKDILGISLVEQSLELHEEVDNLLSIWQDYRVDTDNEAPPSPRSVLPEPPGMRENLRTHICMLLECIREKAKKEGREMDSILMNHNSDVLDYVTEDQSRNSSPGMLLQRPGSARSSQDGRETPMRMTPSSDTDSRMSGTSTVSDQVDSVKDQLNILRIDEVTSQLRSMLDEEIAQLLRDTDFLQECLEEESDFRCQSSMSTVSREPSIQELKVERSKLEKEFKAPPPPSSIGVMSAVKGRQRSLPSSPKRLPSPLGPPTQGSSKVRPSPPPSAGLGSRSTPVKALQKSGHPSALPPSRSSPSRRASDSLLMKDTNSNKTASNDGSASAVGSDLSSSKPMSPVSSLRRTPDSPTRLLPSPPSSAKPSARQSGSSRFRHRTLEAKQSR